MAYSPRPAPLTKGAENDSQDKAKKINKKYLYSPVRIV